MSTHRLIQVATAGVVCAAAYFLVPDAEPADASQQPDVVPVEVRKEDPKKAPTELQGDKAPVEAKPAPVAQSNRLLLPDGTTVPVLNGAFGAPELGWPDDRPWSPIIGKETDDEGDEWYIHEDGSRTITKNVFHSHINGLAPATSVYNPVKPLAMDPAEFKRETDKMARAGRKKAKADAKAKAKANGQKK